MSKARGQAQQPETITLLEWIDASGQTGPVSRSELCGPLPLLTAGFLVCESDESISVCQDYIPKHDEFREVQHILKKNVIKRKEFKVK